MTHEEIEAETARLLGMVHAMDWRRAFVEISCVTGPYPWRVTFGGLARCPTLIQGKGIEDAFGKARRWIEADALGRATERDRPPTALVPGNVDR
jgi:hypothetical protein